MFSAWYRRVVEMYKLLLLLSLFLLQSLILKEVLNYLYMHQIHSEISDQDSMPEWPVTATEISAVIVFIPSPLFQSSSPLLTAAPYGAEETSSATAAYICITSGLETV